jgi:outer membrane receptor protein involved in Fe transport
VITGNPNLKPEELTSYEVGYQGSFLAKKLRLSSNLFYMDIDEVSTSRFVFGAPSRVVFGNTNQAIARGVESEVRYRWGIGSGVYANYTHEHIKDVQKTPVIISATPRHKINLGGILAIKGGFSAGLNAGYKKGYMAQAANGTTLPFHHYWRVDGKLGYSPVQYLEVFVAGQNLTRPRHSEFIDFDGLQVPRIFYGGVSLKFS